MLILLLLWSVSSHLKAQDIAKNVIGNSLFISGMCDIKEGNYREARYWFRASKRLIDESNKRYCLLFIDRCNKKIGQELFLRGVNYLKNRDFEKALASFIRSFFLLKGEEKMKKYIIISNYLKKRSQGEDLKELNQVIDQQKQFYDHFLRAKKSYLSMDFSKALILFSQLKTIYPQEEVIERYYQAAKEGMKIKEVSEQSGEYIRKRSLEALKMFYEDVVQQEELMLSRQRQKQKLALEKFKESKEKYQQKKYYEASELMKQAILLQPQEEVFKSHYEFYQSLAQLESENIVNLKEVKEIQQKVKQHKQHSLYLEKARLAVLEGQFDIAKELLEAISQKGYKDAEIKFYLNLIEEVQSRKEAMNEEIQVKMKHWVKHQEDHREEELRKEALISLEEALDGKNYDKAIKIFNHAMDFWTDKEMLKMRLKDSFFQGAVQLLKNKRYREAGLLFDTLIEKDNRKGRAIYLRYRTLCAEAISKKEEEEKADSLSVSVLQHRDQIASSLEKAKEYHQKEEYLLANKLLEELLSLDPTNIQIRGFKEINDGSLRKSEEQKLEKLRIAEEMAQTLGALRDKEMERQKREILINKGIEYYEKGEYSMAYAIFEEMINKGDDDDLILDYRNSAYSFMKLEESKKRVILDESKKVLQEESHQLFEEAYKLYENGYYYEAVNLFQKSWEVFPEDREQFEKAKHYIEICSEKMQEKNDQS